MASFACEVQMSGTSTWVVVNVGTGRLSSQMSGSCKPLGKSAGLPRSASTGDVTTRARMTDVAEIMARKVLQWDRDRMKRLKERYAAVSKGR